MGPDKLNWVVTPAKAGLQSFQEFLDSRFRWSDGKLEFFRILLDNRITTIAGMKI